MIAYVHDTPLSSSHAFGAELVDSFAELSRLHRDGWGTAWTNRRESGAQVDGSARTLIPPLERRVAGKHGDDLVFTTLLGMPMRNNNFRHRVFKPALERVRQENPLFPVVTPHDLRHTAASLAVSAGANVKAVQRMLGYVSAAMTLDVYADLFDEDLVAVSDALDRDAAVHFANKAWPTTDLGPLH